MTDRTLLVATAGGHLTQLAALVERMSLDTSSALWVTMSTAQSRSMLDGQDVMYVPYGAPRDLRALAKHSATAVGLFKRERFAVVVSTGANLAPPFLAAARLNRVPAHFVESATRTDGPSVAGRLCARIPGVHVYTQHEEWADERWRFSGNLFEGFTTVPAPTAPQLRRAVVSVGSARDFPFPNMVRAVRHALPRDCEVLWQVGDTPAEDLGGRVVSELPAAELAAELARADVVISHAGTGSAFAALEAGRCPLLVPRTADRGEHIDDHQWKIASKLADRQLAVVAAPDDLGLSDLTAAASRVSVRASDVPFTLVS